MGSTEEHTEHRAHFEREALQHRGELFGAAMRMTRCRVQAEDLVQDATLRAWRFWGRFEEGTNCRAWMHRILINSHINNYRRKKRETEIMGQVRAGMPLLDGRLQRSSRLPGEGLGDEVTEALGRLAPDFRQVLMLVDLGGDSYQEAAFKLGCPIGTVMSRLHRARRAMKTQLGEYARAEGYLAQAA